MKVYNSYSYQTLIKQLADNIKHSTNNIFQPELIVGADHSTQQFIKENIAELNNISANLLFTNWSKFFQMVFYYVKPDTYEFHVLSSTKATQLIYEALDNKEFKENNSFIATYYKDNKQKQFGLARKMQALYDNYVKYEPQRLECWNVNELFSNDDNEIWQRELWQIYRTTLQEIELNDSFDIYTALTTALKSNTDRLTLLQKKIPTIHVARIENLSHHEVILLQHLSKHIEINVYQLKVYQGNIITNQWAIDFNHFPMDREHFFLSETQKKANTLLKTLQDNLLHNKSLALYNDSSVQIHGHYTTYREIEGLFNTLIHYAENNDNEFHSRDCVVYCCDLKTYIPAIHYFFNRIDYPFPYRIIGERQFDSNTSLNALQDILSFDIKQMKPSALLKILEYPAIKNKFSIEDITLIKSWIQATNIRYSYLGDIEKETNLISWKLGLDRMLLGSCTGVNDWYDDDTLMVDLAEANSFDLLINFRYFIDNFYAYRQALLTDRTKMQWIAYTKELVNFFFTPDQDDLIQNFLHQIDQLDTKNVSTISFKTWLLFLSPLLGDVSEYKRANVNGITFVELGNAQIIPKPITAIIGLNYNSFPRKASQLDFDLLKNAEEYLKTSVKEIDKNNFLHAILQTSDLLYLSYNSHSSQDNSEIPPSILIEQLLDYTNKEEQVISIVHHPLHGFNSNYNKSDELISYTLNTVHSSDFKEMLTTRSLEENIEEYNVMPHQFINFFSDSFKDFYRSQLGLYGNDEEEEIADEEMFEVNNLDAWAIRNWYIENGINITDFSKKELSDTFKQLKVHGQLPLTKIGEHHFYQAIKNYESVTDAFFNNIKNKEKNIIDIDQIFQIDGHTVNFTGSTTVYDRTYFSPCLSSNTVKGKFAWLINSYLLFKQGVIEQSIFITREKKEGVALQIHMTSENYKNYLSNELFTVLLKHFIDGKRELQPFYLHKNIKVYEETDDLFKSLNNDEYLSSYIKQEISKPYFMVSDDWKQRFLTNNNFLFNLTNIN